MKIGEVAYTTEDAAIGELREAADLTRTVRRDATAACPRVALLTPYTGHNLGDAAIQDAIIANLRLRLPGAQFSGVSLNCDNFVERHGAGAFPLCASQGKFYRMCQGRITQSSGEGRSPETSSGEKRTTSSHLRRVLKQVPVLWPCLRWIRSLERCVYGELRHFAQGYRFLHTQDLLIVSGGGQLDEEWGGPWGHPFALFKWAILARIAGVPYAIASVGACKITSIMSRFFLSIALRTARYRSYRDLNSREAAGRLLRRAARDPVVPDMAFSLPSAELPTRPGIRANSRERMSVAISLIAYARPGSWPRPKPAVYERYLQEMTRLLAHLLTRDCLLVLLSSSLGDDDRVIPELLGRLDAEAREKAPGQMRFPIIKTWKDFVAALYAVDFLVASRLHSTILGFVAQTPTVAISFDPKVDWVMQDLGQADYLLHIRDFVAEDVIQALDHIELHSSSVAAQIRSYQLGVHSAFARQYDTLAQLALASYELRHPALHSGALSRAKAGRAAQEPDIAHRH